jgi:putative phage-type endonuclease
MKVEEMKDRDAWLAARLNGIGGSDAAAVVGISPWKSPFQVWMEKTGQSQGEDLSNNEYVYWGMVLEQIVADRFCELTSKKVRKMGMVRSKHYPFLLADVDRMVVGENAGLECKTANGFAGKQWEDDKLPDQYYLQCQHYMAVTGCDKWYIACLIGGNHFVYKEIDRNEDDIVAIIGQEAAFWKDYVVPRVMPEVDGSTSCAQALKNKFKGGGEAITLPSEAEKLLNDIDTYSADEKALKAAIQEKKNRLCVLLGDAETGWSGERKVTWKVQNGRVTVDSKKLKAELPEVYDKYKHIGKPSRVLRV